MDTDNKYQYSTINKKTDTYNGPDNKRWFDNVTKAENGQAEIGKHTGFYKDIQQHSMT